MGVEQNFRVLAPTTIYPSGIKVMTTLKKLHLKLGDFQKNLNATGGFWWKR